MFFAFSERSRDRRRRWTLAAAYTTLLASCDSPFAPEVEKVVRLEVNPPVLLMVVGATATVTAQVFGAGDIELPTAEVFWSTQNPSVVTINQEGVATAVGAGTAQIAASAGGLSRTIAVTVFERPIALVRVTPPAGNVAVGSTLTLHGEALDGDGVLLPNRPLEWASSAPAIATVSGSGIVTGVSVGEATISATGEGKTGTALITVLPAPVASITIQPDGGSLPAGATLAFTATTRDAAGQPLTGRRLEWRSSDDAVATVSSTGLLTAISPGVVTITVTAPGEGPNGTTPSASVTVTVLIEPAASAVIVPSAPSMQVGATLPLTVNLFDAGGEPLSTAGRTITWSSSNSAVASVNSSGTVTGVTVGTAIITATIVTPGQPGSLQATAQVSVSNQPVASVLVSPGVATVHVGYNRQFTAVARNAAGQTLVGRAILWTSTNQSVATVDAVTGLVTGVSQGSAVIAATSEGVQGTSSVTVDLVAVSAVTVTPSSATLMPAQTVSLSAVPRDSANNVIQGSALGGRNTTWASTNTAVATVSTTGTVTAVAMGSAAVTATIGGTPGQSAITVSPLPSASQLAIVTQPSASPQNDVAFPVQPVIQLKDASGNNVAQAGVTITAAITAPGTGTLGGTVTALTNASGAATFSGLKITGLTGPRTLTFTSGTLTPVTSAAVNLQPGSATQLVITTQPPPSASSGQVFSSPSVVQLRDVSGNDVPQSGVAVMATVQPSAGVTLGGGSATTNASGAATFSALTLNGPAGNYTLTFASGSLTPAVSTTITLGAGSGSKLAIATAPSSTVQSGIPFPVQPAIQLLDGANNDVPQSGVVVTVAILTGGGTIGGTTTAMTNSSGTATFSGLSISGPVGDRTLLFGATGYTTVTSGAITVTAGPAARLAMATQPSSPVASGSAFATPPAVQLQDDAGNPVSQANVSVSVSIGAGASLTGTTSALTDGTGVATFTGLGVTGLAGTYQLSFSSGSLAGTTSDAVTVTAGAATQLSISTQPSGASSGSAFATQPAIQLRDAQGNIVTQSGVTVNASIANSPGGASLVGNATATTDGSGLATFAGLGLSGPVGNYTLTFAATGLTSVTSGTIALGPGAAAQLSIQTQPADAVSGAAFTTQPVILVSDAQGNPVSQAITVNAAVRGATFVGTPSAQTNSSGLATFSGLGLTGPVGNYTIDFSGSGLPTVTSASFPLAAGAAAGLAVVTQPSDVVSGSMFAPSPAVQVEDAAGNPLTTDGIQVSVAISAGGASLTGTTTASTTGGVATFTGLGATGTAGSYTLSFTSSGLTGATSGSFSVTASAPTQVTITTQPPTTAVAGSAFSTSPVVQLEDASGNPVSQAGTPISATLSGTGGGALNGTTTVATDASGAATFAGLSISADGTYTIDFAATGLTSATSSTVTVTLPATQLAVTTEPSANASSGSAFAVQPAVQLRDASNGDVSQAGVQVTAAITGGGATLIGTASAITDASGLATFSGLGISGTVGNYTLTFSASGLTDAVSASIALGAGAAAKLQITIQPDGAVSGAAFSTQPAVRLLDAQDNPVSQSGVTVTASIASGPSGATFVGSNTATTDGTGLATFAGLGLNGTAGDYTLTFTASGVAGTATSAIVTLGAGAAVQLTITTQPGGAQRNVPFATQPVVQLRDSGGNPAPQVVTVTASVATGSGSLSGTVSVATNTSGVASFSNLSIDQTGSHSLQFTAVSIGTVISNPFVVSP